MPRLRPLALGAAVVLVTPALVVANMADPHRPGQAAGEPTHSAELARLAVVHETLRLDLTSGVARVEAVYRVRNDSTARTLDLAFIALGLVDPYADGADSTVALDRAGPPPTVAVDGAPVTATVERVLPVPPEWTAGVRTPSLVGPSMRYASDLDYHLPRPVKLDAESDAPPAPTAPGFTFATPLPAGESEVRVRYTATLGEYNDSGYATPTHQFAYSLAPARRWPSFGTLDVEVLLPPGVDARTSPELSRDGDRLTGSFDGLPADVLGIAYRRPAPFAFHLARGFAFVWLVVVGLGVPAWLGVRSARRGTRWVQGIAWGVGLSILAWTGFAVAFGIAASSAETSYGYGFVFLFALTVVPILLASALVATLAFVLARWAERRRLNPPALA